MCVDVFITSARRKYIQFNPKQTLTSSILLMRNSSSPISMDLNPSKLFIRLVTFILFYSFLFLVDFLSLSFSFFFLCCYWNGYRIDCMQANIWILETNKKKHIWQKSSKYKCKLILVKMDFNRTYRKFKWLWLLGSEMENGKMEGRTDKQQ